MFLPLLNNAKSGPVVEGAVGAGTGTRALVLKVELVLRQEFYLRKQADIR